MAAFKPAQARPAAAGLATAAVGDSGSAKALARLRDELADLRAQAVVPVLLEAVARLRANDPEGASAWARKALAHDPEHGHARHILAIAREKAGDWTGAVEGYEKALAQRPDEADIASDLGRLACKLGLLSTSEKLFKRYLRARPGAVDGVNNLACVLRDQMRFDEAIDLLRDLITVEPHHAMLWNTLGSVCTEAGDMEQAALFYDEALRLDPALTKARYNRGNVRLYSEDPVGALEDLGAAVAEGGPPDEVATMRMAHATALIAAGDLRAGWAAYEARLDPAYADTTRYLANRPRWTPGDALAGQRLLVMGEQGLGDEVLFANVLPDVVEALGPHGTLILAVEPRLVPLFRRSFPTARVEPHGTYTVGGRLVRGVLQLGDWDDVDLWTPVASLLERFRPSVRSFPTRPAFLTPDPARVAHWRDLMEAVGSGLKVGVVWKSLKLDSARARYFSPFDDWAKLLETPAVAFVNLQYGDCAAEMAEARARGLELHQPKGIDLKDDLDDLAALTCALDVVIGPANATTNIAAACGATTWFVTTPGAWPRLGTDGYPWYPTARSFKPPAFNDWAPMMAELSAALSAAR